MTDDKDKNEASEYVEGMGNMFYMLIWAFWQLGRAIRSDLTDLYYWVGRKIGYLPPPEPKKEAAEEGEKESGTTEDQPAAAAAEGGEEVKKDQ